MQCLRFRAAHAEKGFELNEADLAAAIRIYRVQERFDVLLPQDPEKIVDDARKLLLLQDAIPVDVILAEDLLWSQHVGVLDETDRRDVRLNRIHDSTCMYSN